MIRFIKRITVKRFLTIGTDTNGHPNSDKTIEKPEQFELMIELARKLSEGLPHVRVDFYESEGKIYFGELTFFHWGGFVPFNPQEWDEVFGEWIVLSGEHDAD